MPRSSLPGRSTSRARGRRPPETQGGKFRGAAVGSSAGFSYAAQVVEVEVDEETGMVSVDAGVGRARLRPRDQPARGRGPGAGLGVDGHGPGTLRGDALSRGPARVREPARLPRAHDRRVAADRDLHRRGARSERPVRRQGGGRRGAVRVPAGAHQRDRRRDRDRAHGLPATPDRVLEAVVARRRAARLAASKAARASEEA